MKPKYNGEESSVCAVACGEAQNVISVSRTLNVIFVRSFIDLFWGWLEREFLTLQLEKFQFCERSLG